MNAPTSPRRSGSSGPPTDSLTDTSVRAGSPAGSAPGMTHDDTAMTPTTAEPWVRLTRYVLRCMLGITAGTVAVLAVAWAVAVVLASTAGVELLAQITHYATVSTVPWVAFTALVICVGVQVRHYVHAGFTRRAVTVAGLLGSLVVGVVFAVAATALDRVGLGLVAASLGVELSMTLAPWWALLGAMLMVCLTGAVCGVLVGASFVRWGGRATLLLPLTVGLPYFAQDVLARSVTLRGEGPGGPPSWLEQVQAALPTVPTAALSLLALGLTVAGAWLILRRLPLPPRANP
ncbi:hypothetical protein [uncultured Serinicoccus sp.]|uniref:hypothetical protein n=1 Tax=uncultured Serinicoccus sp. TaxID=735514 RepID=UPI002608A903|nr:hypothetical protein [uncultured Serinicoccus sp.]